MDTFLPAFIMGFREGLEAFLIVSIILQYLRKSKNESLRKYVYYGTIGGIVASLGIGAFFTSCPKRSTKWIKWQNYGRAEQVSLRWHW